VLGTPHSHPWEESFYVTKGTVQFTCNDQTFDCHEGTLVNVPAEYDVKFHILNRPTNSSSGQFKASFLTADDKALYNFTI